MAKVVQLESGVETDEVDFIWRVRNFRDVVGHEMALSQQFSEVEIGRKIGRQMKISLMLRNNKRYDGDVDLYGVSTDVPNMEAVGRFTVDIEARIVNADGSVANEKKHRGRYSWSRGFSDITLHSLITSGGQLPLTEEGDLVINGKLRLIAEQPDDGGCPVKKLTNFHHRSTKRTEAKLMEVANGDATPVRFVSVDGDDCGAVAISLLKAQSDVFIGMLQPHTSEGQQKTITLKKMRGVSCRVLVQYFVTGRLEHSWQDPDVVVELLDAALMLQLPELIKFMDSVIGKVCVRKNVLELLQLASLAGLDTATADLLDFFAREGRKSVQNIGEMISGK